MITVQDIINKRWRIWHEKHDLDYDKGLVKASAIKILSTPALVEEVRAKPYLLIEVAFYIVDKKRETVPFFFNEVQRDFIGKLETLGTNKPFCILKGRQQGFTSVITAIQLAYAIVKKNFSGFTMADRADNTASIFNDKARAVYDRLPDELKPSEKFNSRNELFFDKLNSSWRIATATNEAGRSRTLNFVHFSEVAFYECSLSDLQAGIGEAITAGAIQIYETTANGFNEAKDLWDSGSCHNLFYEWWRTAEYRSEEYQYLETTDPWLIARMKVLKEKGLDREQITWYCKKYAGYLDKNTIKQEYPITPEEAFVSSGDCVFDLEALNNQIVRVSGLKPPRRGYFTYRKVCEPIILDGKQVDVEWHIRDIKFRESKDGYIYLYEEPKVQRNKDKIITAKAPYAIGGDTAGSGEDYFTGKVINNLTQKTAAMLRKQRIDEDLYAEQMYCLGIYYNEALVGIETNYSRQPMRILQRKYNYPSLYLRERLDKMTDKTELVPGFETTTKTKPIIISELVELIRDDPAIEVDMDTLKEMTTFVKKENGKQEAIQGAHDDLVMATAIAHFVAKQQTHQWIEVQPEKDNFLEENFHQTGGETNEAFMSWEDF